MILLITFNNAACQLIVRFAFQVTGTLVVFVLLWILMAKLPQPTAGPNNPLTLNVSLMEAAGASCNSDDVSQLNFCDKRAFWVSSSSVVQLITFIVLCI